MARKAVVAGQFYSANKAALAAEVGNLLISKEKKSEALAAVCPHAGYIYSGQVAGAVYSRLEVPAHVVILCPNHTGMGQPASVMSQGSWETPLGSIVLSTALAERMKEETSLIEEDVTAHLGEHSLEVQLPFLQLLREDFQLVPLCLGSLPYSACEALGAALARVVADFGQKILLVASTDMTHYEDHEVATRKDKAAIERIMALDPAGLYDTVKRRGITMCGYIPTTVVLTAAKELGATQAELVMYRTSADVTGDFDQVVGYAGIIIR